MNDDDLICLCFHVSKRKVMQYIRVQQPSVASQLTECYGAGTGCGWCRPYLAKLMEQADSATIDLPERKAYAAGRKDYRKHKRPGQSRTWSAAECPET